MASVVARDWKAICRAVLAAMGALWTALEILAFWVKISSSGRTYLLPVFLLLSVGIGLVVGRRPNQVTFTVPGTDTKFALAVGNLFETDGSKAIAVNEFFDTSLPRHVSPNSLHGQFLQRYFQHREGDARSAFDQALPDEGFVVVERTTGARRRYPKGTTIVLELGSDRFLLVALTETNVETLQASADADDLRVALNGLWDAARQYCQGAPLAVPLIGSGLARIGLPSRQLLDTLIASAVLATRASKVTNEIKVVLSQQVIEDVDLREIRRAWA